MKSPLKDKPLHNPGQSGDEYIQNYLLDKVAPPILFAALLVLLAIMEWYKWYTNIPPTPKLMTLVAVVALIYALIRWLDAKKKLRALRLGRDGEITVGQQLELLRADGAKIFHDIPADGFNLDHVIIHKSNIYVIETKTYSQPEKIQSIITYDGKNILVDGEVTDKKPVDQVKAACSWLKELLKKSTGKECNPKPVLVFPGWFVKQTAEAKNSDVWVLNPKALPAFILNTKAHIKDEDVNLFSFHLSRYIQSES